MSSLNTRPNIADPDDFYARLLALHDGLTKAQSDALNARLILLLANHVGDDAVLRDALQAAVASVREPAPSPGASFSTGTSTG
jgi:Protein of unknown function (DUF2783)